MTANTETTSFSGLDRLLADITLCKKELRETKVEEMDLPQFQKWTRDQLLHTQVTLVEQLAKAMAEELTEIGAEMINQGEAIQNIIDEDGSFLTPDMANDLKATFALGMAITGILEGEKVTLENDLKNKQLQDAVKLYKTHATILLGQIDEITQEEEEDDDDSNIHGQGEDSGSAGGDEPGDAGDGAGDADAGDGATDADAGDAGATDADAGTEGGEA